MTRGFISITTMRPSAGLIAHCTFEPPVSTPISRSTAIEPLRMIWYSLSVSVSAGATVMQSPVWTPIGSTFSMEQTMIALSLRSRTTSISNSFQPSRDSSTRIWATGEASRPGAADRLVVVAVVGDAAAGAAEGEGGADDGGQADIVDGVDGLLATPALMSYLPLGSLRRGDDRGLGVFEPDPVHRLAEQLAVLCHFDGCALGADQLDVELFQHAHVGERQRGVQPGLPAHRRQERVGAFLLDDLGDDFGGDRLDIGGVRQARIGHDRGGVGVDEDDAVAFLAQRLAGLGAGIVELAGLADDDGTGADDHDRLDVGSLRHHGPPHAQILRGYSHGRSGCKPITGHCPARVANGGKDAENGVAGRHGSS